MSFMPLLWILLLGVIVWAVVRQVKRPTEQVSDRDRRETPQEILDRRYALGGIDTEAYTEARARLAERQAELR